jgi:calcium binding protein
MPEPRLNRAREKRITDEIVVDAYTSDERAMCWYYYLEDSLAFPFKARCAAVTACPAHGRTGNPGGCRGPGVLDKEGLRVLVRGPSRQAFIARILLRMPMAPYPSEDAKER